MQFYLDKKPYVVVSSIRERESSMFVHVSKLIRMLGRYSKAFKFREIYRVRRDEKLSGFRERYYLSSPEKAFT